jgi:FHA domain/zinc-ribbon domain
VIWRRRRSRARSGAARSGSSGSPSRWASEPVEAGARSRRADYGTDYGAGRSSAAWQMDQPRQPQVPWTAQADVAREYARTDTYSTRAARPMMGRLGASMPSVYCPGCGEANPDTARFCSQCGTPLTRAGSERGTVGETTSMIFTGAETTEAEPGDESAADSSVIDALPPNTALLVVKRGPNAGSRFLLDSDLTEVGRRPDSDIFLDDVTVSRRHAEFYRHTGRFAVRDVGSLNGTYVNRERIEEAALTGGDEVQIGKFRLVFLQGRQSQYDAP